MNIAVITITRDRLDYTKRTFASLEANAGYPYTHMVFDNGSVDGTKTWLNEWCTEKPLVRGVIHSPTNRGIGFAWKAAASLFRFIELVVKIDNDCEIRSENLLGQLVECFKGRKRFGSTWILSPRVEGINHQPERVRYTMLAGRRIGVTPMVGGLCMAVPTEVLEAYKFPTNLPLARGYDSHLCDWFRRNGGETGYVEGLIVEHMGGTDGQALKYPEYFERKKREEM